MSNDKELNTTELASYCLNFLAGLLDSGTTKEGVLHIKIGAHQLREFKKTMKKHLEKM